MENTASEEFVRSKEIKLVPIESIVPNEKNRNQHPQDQIDRLAKIIEFQGFRSPLIVSNQSGKLVSGHGRLLAAKQLGLESVPVMFQDFDNEDMEYAAGIAENAIALWAELDLSGIHKDLPELGLGDLDFLGIRDFQLEPDPDAQGDEDAIPATPAVPKSRLGELWHLGRHRLLIGDATKEADVGRLMAGEQADLVFTDPPYNVNYEGSDGQKIQNDDMDNADFLIFLLATFNNYFGAMKEGAGIYVFHADTEGGNFRTAFKSAGLKLSSCLIWNKSSLIMGRSDYHWKHEPCQPAGTMVRTPGGEVPIEQLRDGDRVVSYDSYSGVITGMRDGRAIRVAVRNYDGDLYGIRVGDRQTWATDSHQFSVKFAKDAPSTWVTYLMRRGNWWRVGVTRAFNSLGFGLKVRLKGEDGEQAWVLGVYKDKLDAVCAEQVLSVKYGIPQTHWNTQRGFVGVSHSMRSELQIKGIYEALDLKQMDLNADRLLKDFGRRRSYPFIERETCAELCSKRVTMKVAACNIIPEIMIVPIPNEKWAYGKTFTWQKVDAVERRDHHGPVYSLEVEKDEHYVADGIVTHNCLYGWKPGAGHHWYGDRTQTTVFDHAKGSGEENKNHPTSKPVSLVEYFMGNSSKKGDLVLDLFLGGGSTLIAAEKNGRRCCGMELDPKYADVILQRFRDFSGQDPVREDGVRWSHL
jgi:DNA modification methylase